MQKDLQLTIWQFILAYKQHGGEQVNYIDFATHENYRENALRTARETGIPQLSKLADKIEHGFLNTDTSEPLEPPSELSASGEFEETESFLLSEAPAEVWEGKQSVTEARRASGLGGSSSSSAEEKQTPAERYAYRLSSALKRSEFSLLHRRALDRFARKHRMSASQVQAIENETRSKLKLGPLKWDQELSSVIKDLSQNHDSLETLKKQLKNTYVREDRLDQVTFLRIYDMPREAPTAPTADTPTKTPTPQNTQSSGSFIWLVLGGVLLIGLLLAATLL